MYANEPLGYDLLSGKFAFNLTMHMVSHEYYIDAPLFDNFTYTFVKIDFEKKLQYFVLLY